MRRVLIILLFASSALAQDSPINGHTLYWENDTFGIGRKSDRYYTNGVKATWLLTEAPDWAGGVREVFCKSRLCTSWRRSQQVVEGVNVVLGQNLYTPQRITIAAPQPRERPWAGLLYTGVSESIVNSKETVLNTIELQVGIMGQGAGAQATQKFVHNDLGLSNNDPAGWQNQLKNEPAINLMWRHARRYGNNTIDVIPEGSAMLGSVQTYMGGAITARLGWHMLGFPVGVISPAALPRGNDDKPHKFEAHVFVTGEARWVPHNATLDGGFFRDNGNAKSAPDPERVVNDLRAGLSLRWKWVRLTYTVVERSEEFQVPRGTTPEQRFGSFALTLEPLDVFR